MTLFTQVQQLGVGGAGLVVEGRPGAIGHAFALVHTSDRGLQVADNGVVIPAHQYMLRAAFQVRALLIKPNGQPHTPTWRSPAAGRDTTARPRTGTALGALTDAASPHIGMHPRRMQGHRAYPPVMPPAVFMPGAGPSSQPVPATAPGPSALAAVINAARPYIGRLRWRGRSAPDPQDGWQISRTTSHGQPNDFARWIRGTGDEPGPDSTMAAHEAIFFSAYHAGLIDLTWLQRVYAQATERAKTAHTYFQRIEPRDGHNRLVVSVARSWVNNHTPEAVFSSVLTDYLAPGPRRRYIDPGARTGAPDIPAGHVVLFDGIDGHVALSLGTRDPDSGYQQVLSLFRRTHNIPRSWEQDSHTGFLQITTVEELTAASGFRVVEFAAPPWASPATKVVAAARQLEGKLRWRGGIDPVALVNTEAQSGIPDATSAVTGQLLEVV